MEKQYHKLVRDRIPEIIAATGQVCRTQIVTGEAYQQALDQKLTEELAEYQESKSPEELADLLEVIIAAAAARGVSWEQLFAIREEKRQKRGGFEKGIFLLSVDK